MFLATTTQWTEMTIMMGMSFGLLKEGVGQKQKDMRRRRTTDFRFFLFRSLRLLFRESSGCLPAPMSFLFSDWSHCIEFTEKSHFRGFYPI